MLLLLIYVNNTNVNVKINYNNLTKIESNGSPFDKWPWIKYHIANLKQQESRGVILKEADYNRIMFALFPYYCNFRDSWIIAPESWSQDPFAVNKRCDAAISKILAPDANLSTRIVYEGKARTAISWWRLLREQVWDEADGLKRQNGTVWVICNIGFEVCFFEFDILRWQDTGDYTNFSPLNIRGFDQGGLQLRGIDYLEQDGVIKVIKWRLDDLSHFEYIDELLDYVFNFDVR